MMTNRDYVTVAQEAVKAAAKVAKASFGQRIVATYKVDQSPVTQADLKAEAAAIEVLQAGTPGFGIVAEESGANANTSRPYWVIDPIDGTRNFARSLPLCASGVALIVDGEIVVAAVELIATGEQYVASRGHGATYNGEPIRISPDIALDRAVVAFSASPNSRRSGQYFEVTERLIPNIGSLRVLASSLVQGCYVADGRIDAYVGFHAAPWDVAPLALLVQEAGGTLLDFEGNLWTMESPNLIAAHSSVARAIVDQLAIGDRQVPSVKGQR